MIRKTNNESGDGGQEHVMSPALLEDMKKWSEFYRFLAIVPAEPGYTVNITQPFGRPSLTYKVRAWAVLEMIKYHRHMLVAPCTFDRCLSGDCTITAPDGSKVRVDRGFDNPVLSLHIVKEDATRR